MKKINLFNKTISPLSSGKGCPVERGGVWELPRRTPCATPSWKEGERSGRGGLWFAALVALFVATPSFATPTELDKKTVASKAYVDTKQDIIETGLVEFNDNPEFMLPAITTYDSTSGLVGNKIGILDQDTIEDDEGILIMYNNGAGGYGAEMDNFVPTVRAVSEALQLIMERLNKLSWNNTQSTAINAYNTEFGNGTNQWAGNSDDLIKGQFLANSLALKQNKITTGLVEFEDTETEAVCEFPSLVSYDTTSGLIGNKIGVYNYETCGPLIDDLQTFVDLGANSSAYLDNYVPTLRAVAKAFEHTWENIYEVVGWNPLTWNNTQSTAINAYNSTFGNGTNQWAGSSADLINGRFLANSLALKQNILPAKSTGNAAPKGNQAVVLNTAGYPSNVYTTAGKDLALTAKSGAQKVMNYVDGTTTLSTFATNQGLTQAQVKSALVSLELLKDVYGELNSKITNNALPTGTTGTVVTYNGTNATTGVQQFTETAIASAATYDANDQLSNGNSIANVTLVETKQTKRVCGGYEPGHENDPDYCWLWDFPD